MKYFGVYMVNFNVCVVDVIEVVGGMMVGVYFGCFNFVVLVCDGC